MRRRPRTRSLARLASLPPLALLACAADPLPPVVTLVPIPVAAVTLPAAPPPAPRDDGRLPPLATPLRYVLSLDVDPNQPRFSGRVRILVQVPAATSYIVLNGRGLAVKDAWGESGGARIHATATLRNSKGGHDPEEVVLAFDRPVPAGQAVLDLQYDAPFDETLAGLYRVKDGDRWYAFSQFEANDARRAFPCFDEPGFKVPFDVSVTAPSGLLAVSNMPETQHVAAPGGTRFDFQTSPPLPSYLVAFAVGDFDVRQGQTSPVPIRLITTKGKAPQGTLALEDAAALTAELASYFGITYPYPKLDLVAVPNFAAGAMENAGFITFREEAILLDPKDPPRAARIEQATIICHELAHQWFGDLVTMAWWDDLWLNEGFATWAETKITQQWRPSFHVVDGALAAMGSLMTLDSLQSARAVRQPVRTTAEADEAFDRLTYEKGAAVLRMIEHAVGPHAFQQGVRAYLRAHAWKNATANDLIAALSEAAGSDVAPLAASFLDRPGVPNVTVAIDCKQKPAELVLHQSPWHPIGTTSDSASATWLVPFDARTAAGEWRTMLTTETARVPAGTCPTWVIPNVEDRGYYRYSLDEKGWTALAAVVARDDVPTKLGFLTNAWAGVKAGTLDPALLLRLLPTLDGERDRDVLDAELGVLAGYARQLVSDAARPAFARYVTARVASMDHALDAHGALEASGATAREMEKETMLARASLFSAASYLADDPRRLREASEQAALWLEGRGILSDDAARAMVTLGSRTAGADRLVAIRRAMKDAKSPYARKTAMLALGGFDDPTLLDQGLDVLLTDEVPSQDVLEVLGDAMDHPRTRLHAFDWTTRHWDALKTKMPAFYLGYTFSLAEMACTKSEIDRVAAFFGPRAGQVEGARRPYDEALEAATRCAALRESGQPSVDRFFHVKTRAK